MQIEKLPPIQPQDTNRFRLADPIEAQQLHHQGLTHAPGHFGISPSETAYHFLWQAYLKVFVGHGIIIDTADCLATRPFSVRAQ